MTVSPLPAWLSGWSAQRRWALDALTVAAIVALGTLRGPDDVSIGVTGPLFTVALALPLLWRRRWPAAVFAVIATVAAIQWAAGVQAFGDAALLVALYTVAATQPLRTALVAAAVVEAGIGLAVARWSGDQPVNAVVALTGLATAAAVLGINTRHRRALMESLRERAERLEAERDQQNRLAASAERSRIAREMHDIVAHNLSVMIALADGASYAVHDDPAGAELAMRNTSRTGREALTEMRRLLGVLREEQASGPRTPQPGLGEIEALVDQVRAAGVPTTVAVSGAPPAALSRGLELAAYRIVQESLTNVLKHGDAGAQATVELRWTGPRLQLTIANTGAPVAAARSDEGGGLRGMRERAAVYDGRVVAGPQAGGGWAVGAELLAHAAAPEAAAVPAS